mmetsp:Transcript_13161/g.55117  ORF Transcript_13161/g.55117 Transcript_13161/m.55117 type:complete len:212 (-) Transcript_13161:1488-2123(-)
MHSPTGLRLCRILLRGSVRSCVRGGGGVRSDVRGSVLVDLREAAFDAHASNGALLPTLVADDLFEGAFAALLLVPHQCIVTDSCGDLGPRDGRGGDGQAVSVVVSAGAPAAALPTTAAGAAAAATTAACAIPLVGRAAQGAAPATNAAHAARSIREAIVHARRTHARRTTSRPAVAPLAAESAHVALWQRLDRAERRLCSVEDSGARRYAE